MAFRVCLRYPCYLMLLFSPYPRTIIIRSENALLFFSGAIDVKLIIWVEAIAL